MFLPGVREKQRATIRRIKQPQTNNLSIASSRNELVSGNHNRSSKRPALCIPGPDEKKDCAQDQRSQSKKDNRPLCRCKNKHPANQRNNTREGVKPHPVRARRFWSVSSEKSNGKDLPNELDEDPGCD